MGDDLDNKDIMILSEVDSIEGARQKDIRDRVDLPRSTLSNRMSKLVSKGYLVENGINNRQKTYHLSDDVSFELDYRLDDLFNSIVGYLMVEGFILLGLLVLLGWFNDFVWINYVYVGYLLSFIPNMVLGMYLYFKRNNIVGLDVA